MRYSAIVEAAPEGGWVVAVPSLKGSVTQGEDRSDAEYMARDLIATVFDVPVETVQVTLTEVGTGGIDSIVDAWHAKAQIASGAAVKAPPRAVRFGGLRGELVYDDAAFEIDPEIQGMFHGNDASPGHHG